MIKKILYSLLFLISGLASAQQGNASAYSFFGIGDIKFKGTTENRSMGTVSIFSDSIHLNLQNPAGYGSLSRSTYSVGGTQARVKVYDENQSGTSTRTSLDYFSVGIPLGKVNVGLGILPLSSVGYNLISPTDNISTPQKEYTGKGGVNRAYLAAGYKINKNFSVGIEGNVNFGLIETTGYTLYPDRQYGTLESKKSNLSGFGINTGLLYSKSISQKLTLYSGLTYAPEINIKSSNSQTLSTTIKYQNNTTAASEQLEIPSSTSTIKLPSKISFGLGIGQHNKWFTGAEITQQSKTSNFTDVISNASYEAGTRIAIGGHYIPNSGSYSNYWERIVYRAGFRHENTGLVIKNNSITEYGITFGLGLPLNGISSNINIGLEYGSRGTTSAGLVKEDFLNIMISLSLNDKWFNKRKID